VAGFSFCLSHLSYQVAPPIPGDAMDHQTKMPTVGIMLVDRDHGSMELMGLAVCNGSADREL
jgi:hypothetical protein